MKLIPKNSVSNIVLPLVLISALLIFNVFCGEPEKSTAQISMMTHAQIDSLLTAISKTGMTITDRINFFSEKFLGMDYSWQSTGEGPQALLEDWPLVNFQQTNCMVYCEHVLALSISDSWDNFFNNLQQIRYKDGVIGMRSRNHYTMADWLPENNWILEDVSRRVGGDSTKTVTRTISHLNFFRNKGISDLRHVLPDREITIDYIPIHVLPDIEKNLKNGDIAAVLFADKTDIFSAHMLMIIEKAGKKFVRESTTRGMTTFDTPYRDWTAAVMNNEKYIGLSFMRVRDELNSPGKVILPWEIAELKK